MIRTIHLWVSMALALVLHAQSPTIRGYQYWFDQFDQNDANAFFEAVAPATTVNLNNVPLNTESLSIGSHNVHLRLKDQASDGTVRWSSVVTRTFKKFHTGPWEIVAVRYWVGTPINEFDPLVRTKVFDTPEQQFELEDGPLDLCGYPTGNQTLKLQLKCECYIGRNPRSTDHCSICTQWFLPWNGRNVHGHTTVRPEYRSTWSVHLDRSDRTGLEPCAKYRKYYHGDDR